MGDYGPAVKVDPSSLLPGLDQDSATKMYTIFARMPGDPVQFVGRDDQAQLARPDASSRASTAAGCSGPPEAITTARPMATASSSAG